MENAPLPHQKTSSYSGVILGLITVTHAMNIYSGRSIVPLTPLLQADLDLSHFQIGMFTSIFFCGAFLLSIPMGWLADRIGVKWAIALGQCMVGSFILCISFAHSFFMVCAFLFLAGMGHATINPSTGKAVMDWFSEKRRATAMGIKQTGVPIGGALAGASLPALALTFGWRKAFVVAGAVSLVSVLCCLLLYRKPHQEDDSQRNQLASPSPTGSVFKNRDLILLSLLMIAFIGLQSSLETYLVLYCNHILLYPVITAGFFLSLAHLGGISGRVTWGYLSDFFFGARRKIVLMVIGTISSVLCLTFSLLTSQVSIWVVGVLVVLFGGCAIGWNGMYFTLAAELAGRGKEATALGISLTIAFLGHVIGPPLFGYVVDATGKYKYAWLLFFVIMATTTALIGLVREPKKQYASTSI